MKILLRIVAVVFVIIAAVLIYAVIDVAAGDEKLRVGGAIAYIVGAILLLAGAAALWRRSAAAPGAGGTGPAV